MYKRGFSLLDKSARWSLALISLCGLRYDAGLGSGK